MNHLREQDRGPDRFAHRIGDLISGVMKDLGLEQRLWERAITEEWPTLVGRQVAAHTRPGPLERGTLVVFVRHSTWLAELRHCGMQEILLNLQKRFGADRIRAVRLQLDPEPPA